MSEEIIKKNFQEYVEIAQYSFQQKKYNAATTLYYKALVELCDLQLYRRIKKIGANHNERFDLLQQISPQLYRIASKLFRYYRDSYNKEITVTIAQLIKEEVENAQKIVLP